MEQETFTSQTGAKERRNEMYRSLNREQAFPCIRSVEGEDRTVELTFSSEEPYARWWGLEILDHSDGCLNLERLNSIGCVLFNHNRDRVIAKIVNAWNDGSRGHAKIQFDRDEASDTIYEKVKSGTLKGVSTGYLVEVWEEVGAGKKSSDGRFTGPCDIAKRWTPYEISIVSVPADHTVGVGRELREEGPYTSGRTLDYFNRQLQINKNRIRR